ncbi:hypothetical protein JMJ77_0009879 [Colletotrichum scovillei]|uniref:Uncharacterized protein n=1 Tax=Colletotrichum scovillei TaxID=1209932 RepID=A0A9P7QQ02_9PEZI|nr:hypothetical protein JMJ78_0005959 [Colletotrichum scovillei]KAG7040418.1 hypothetical protein JMJ77_0009879 [Colletotrichum scovillei]KAG7060467.1 hypothetical protein JMJ76_0009268 [Colletotrichum scovillei]
MSSARGRDLRLNLSPVPPRGKRPAKRPVAGRRSVLEASVKPRPTYRSFEGGKSLASFGLGG